MKCFVTGATGFIGSNLAHELVARGHRVVALVRPDSDQRALQGLDVERVQGDITDAAPLKSAMQGCEWCFHVAASYQLWLKDYTPLYRANVDGARNVLEAARNAGCARIVYTSTVGCIGLPSSQNGSITPSNEDTPVTALQMENHYKMSKWRAEEIARNLAKAGAPIVIVNPSAPVGPRDVKPTPTGRVIVDFLNRRLPAYMDTGLNWVHVRDVAVGHILAAEKGRVGQRYILGNAEGNWSMKQALDVLAEVSGVRAPFVRLPAWVALAAAHVSEGVAKYTGKCPRATLAGVRMARHKIYFSPAKTITELGLPQTPPRQALSDAVAWFRENGYTRR